MTYLADKHGALTHPAGSIARAQQDAMTFRILDEIDAVLLMAARHSFLLPPDMRHPEIKETLRVEYAQSLAALAEDLHGPFLAGEMLTVPDILLTHCCNWAVSAKFPGPPAALTGYLAAMRARPAFKHVRALA
jgi:glutathione S-transferase